MADLQREKSYVTLVGKAKITDKSFTGEQTSQTTGYKYTRINLGVETAEGNVIYGEVMGGYSPSKPILFARTKEGNQPVEINYADRLNESVLDTLADHSFHRVGLEKDGDNLVVKKFLSPLDLEEYLKANLQDGTMVMVRGSFEFSEYNDNVQRKFKIQDIFLSKKEEGEGFANFVQTVLLTEDSFKKVSKKDLEDGEIVIPAFAVNYVSKKDGKEIKKNLPFAVPITVKINKEDPSVTEKILNALFKVKKGKVRKLHIEGQIIEGYDSSEVSTADIELSADIKELIAMGLYSEEEAKAKMTVRGNKVRKLVFTRPFLQKDKDDPKKFMPFMDDEQYTPDDLVVNVEKEESIDISETDLTSNDSSDNSWLGALGIN